VKKNTFIQLLLLSTLFFACKKNKDTDTPLPAEGSREQLTLDSIYLYAQQIYLWYGALPKYDVFKPREYATGGYVLNNYQRELYDLTQFQINPATGAAYEYSGTAGRPKYSFMVETTNPGGRIGAVDLLDKGDDFGLALSAIATNDVRIRYVNPASAAAVAGLTRGIKVLSMNGTTLTSGSVSFIESALSQSTVSLSVVNSTGTVSNVTLVKKNYTTSPVLKAQVINTASQKVGYIALSRFSILSNAETLIKAAFDQFAQQSVTALVIDLRYNGGGYTNTAGFLLDQIAPASLTGKVMYIEYFNDLLQQRKAPILKQQVYYDANGNTQQTGGHLATYADMDFTVAGNTYKFGTDGMLNTVKQVVFIVSGNTASASELVINSLKPHMPVKLVGRKTYGKPVGFFGIKIDAYTVYLSSFTMQNSKGEGDYYNGMEADIPATDDVSRDFGDEAESSLAAALNYINGHPTGERTTTVNPVIHMGESSFNGMIESRLKLR
jgi:C-terminal processing protease CtpA/Prc